MRVGLEEQERNKKMQENKQLEALGSSPTAVEGIAFDMNSRTAAFAEQVTKDLVMRRRNGSCQTTRWVRV
jgi:hypothetical protein